MQWYILRRLLAAIPVLLIVAILVFGLLYLTPGDAAVMMAGELSEPEDVERIRAALGLDRPFHIRLGLWLVALAQGDLGNSVFSQYEVTTLIWDRVEPTVSLAFLTTIFSIAVGVPLGVLAAWKANSLVDRMVMLAAAAGLAMPAFFLGFILIWVFGLKIPIFPVAGYASIFDGFGAWISRLILPTLATAAFFVAIIARMTRASMIEILQEDYILTARSKGLAERLVLFRHAMRNAALPVLTIIGAGMAALFSGLVVVEKVFAIPGLGRLLVDSISTRDFPVIQGMILVVSAIYVLMNLIIDVLYAYLDPRIRY